MSHGFEENEISVNANGGSELQVRRLAQLIDPELLKHFQIVQSRVRELDDTKIRIIFFNDLPNDPEAQKFRDINMRNNFHHSVFISDWQYQIFNTVIGYPLDSKSSVIEVGFDPISVDWSQKTSSVYRFCYTSTPQRGLEILVPVFAEFAKRHADVQLDVFSSFKIYGWDKADEQFAPLFKQVEENKSMNYHGFVPHDEVIDYLKTAHVFAYPCIWHETSCKAMEEAMSAGLLCVHPNLAALPSTSGALNLMYQFDMDRNAHAAIFGNALENAYAWLKGSPQVTDHLKAIKSYVDNRYNIMKVKFQWEHLMKSLLAKYPTPESRKRPTDQIWMTDTAMQVQALQRR